MKRRLIIVIALIMIIIPTISLGRVEEDLNYFDVKIGRTYAALERVRVSTEGVMAIYQKNEKGDSLMELPGKAMYISLSLGRYDEIDVYDDSNTYVATLPANGTVLFGTESGSEGMMSVDGKKYRGYITFIGNRNGLYVINHVDIESYLYGVVPKEIPSLSSEEALKAQAIAARSYAYSTMNKHINEGYNICDTTHCQVYGGYDAEQPTTNRAVDNTMALVAQYNGSVASTVFHSSSGGHTESSENVWGGRVPYLVAVEDPYSLNTINSNWEVTIDSDSLSKKLLAGGIDIGDIRSIDIAEKTESGRVMELVLNGSNGNAEISGERFRSLIGTTTIKSTLFSVEGNSVSGGSNSSIIYAASERRIGMLEGDRGSLSIISDYGRIRSYSDESITVIGDSGVFTYKTPDTIDISRGSVVISGRGFGHGIGMSQYGAIEMAKQGFDFEEILEHYYTGIEITKY
ncbi:SpoIID/LytB domain-containing protein [Gudongella sp. SC589]|uniref:SpoIID/LytB domain-containing protein n=1 Tax=Gudongella sp. SC589 TaxID=3385990 RepID=UPI003904D73A